MKEYHKIDSVYKRDERGNFLIGEFSRPEFEYLKDLPWLWTEKVDGTNIRVMYHYEDGEEVASSPAIWFNGKSENSQIPAKLVKNLEDTFVPKTRLFMETFGSSEVCLYGEGYGAGIQKGGGNYSPDQKFILFDVKIGDWWLQRKDVEDIATKLGIDVVYVIKGTITLSDMIQLVSTTGPALSAISENATIEGWVGIPYVPLFARNGDRIITKIKYKDFK